MASTRLYSWVDVEQLVRSRAGRGDWPEGVAEFGAWWDGVELDVAPGGEQSATDWLTAVFGPLFDPLNRKIRLETGERLPVLFVSNGFGVAVRRPRLRATKITAALARPLPGPVQRLAGPPVAAFHSFKGGVGRTLHALATARAVASTSPVLLVDGDLEAPGISWILSGRLPDPIIAYTDLLALVQGASNGDIDSVIELVAERLQNQALDGVFVLPSMRDGTPADVGMGSTRSREARSTPWVLAALSDFRPQIQARDVVTFLHESAKRSVGEPAIDRILTPNAMRAAFERCSEEKIKAIEEEDPRLGDVFQQLREVSPELRRTPFRPSDIGLSAAALELLLGTGAAMRIDDVYWMPEIYRHGLGFQNAVARPRVIQLANRARR